MNAPLPPPGRAQDMSPVSAGSDSAWSGMNGYSNMRSDGPYNVGMPPRGDSRLSPDGAPPRMNGGPGGPGGPGRPPSSRRRPSEAGSQQSSRAASVANSRSSDGTISDQGSRRYRRMETELQQHYTILKAFLKGGAQQPPRPNKARDKLLRLSPVQFHELSTDVFDELQRRQAAAPLPGREPRQKNVPPFLQPVPQFHEKRNQARQKLSSLQTPRFRDLSTDVYCELERRFPHFANPDGRRRDSTRSNASRAGSQRPPLPHVHTSNNSTSGPNGFPPRNGSMQVGGPHFDNSPGSASPTTSEFGRPMPKQFQSNTITPNKSTMVEDDEDDDDGDPDSHYGRDRSSDAFGLESSITSPMSDHDTPATSVTTSRDMKALQDKVANLEMTLQERDDGIRTLKQDLERKVQDAERLNKSLQDEIDRLQSDHANMERDLRSQINASQNNQEDDVWRDRHDQLYHDHQHLQARYQEQQKLTEEVSRQGELFLSEMRAMAENGGGNLEREEKLQLDVHKLEEELKEWKARYAKIKTQLRNDRTTSASIGISGPDAERLAQDNLFRAQDGLIKDVHVSQFQISINGLLQAARSPDATSVIAPMQDVVMAVRSITLDIDSANASLKDDETNKRRLKLRSKVSATANNVITASKNYAAANGLSPVSLLDAAASHLSAAVIDLIRMVKIRPTHPDEHDEEESFQMTFQIENTPEPVNNAGYFNMGQRLRRSSAADSEYSALSSPGDDARSNGTMIDATIASHAMNGHVANGLGIQPSTNMGEDDTELQELKIYLENQTDLLAQTIQALVASIRNEEMVPSVQAHISAIVDTVENVLSAAEGAMEDASSYQAELRDKAAVVVQSLTRSKDNLLQAGNDPKVNVGGRLSKTFTQQLPPLAFQIARETKLLVSKIESVEAGKADEDFS